jgi:thiamine pyrophosphate-dependent acetolactate synthase large subunit-like protein
MTSILMKVILSINEAQIMMVREVLVYFEGRAETEVREVEVVQSEVEAILTVDVVALTEAEAVLREVMDKVEALAERIWRQASTEDEEDQLREVGTEEEEETGARVM